MARKKLALPAAPSNPRSDADYQSEDDLRTLERAEEVRGDAGRHKRAMMHGRKRMSVMQRVVGDAPKGRSRGRASQRTKASGR